METYFITLTGFDHYCGKLPFKIGHLVYCQKEPDNPYDGEAIAALMPMPQIPYCKLKKRRALSKNPIAKVTLQRGKTTLFTATSIFIKKPMVSCRLLNLHFQILPYPKNR